MQQLITKPCAPDYLATRVLLTRLRRAYPDAGYGVCGRSLCGRAIFTLSVGDLSHPVLFAGGFHGQEWLTPLVLFRFFERLCRALDTDGMLAQIDIRSALEGRGVLLLPCVNPDGTEIALHGVQAAGSYAFLVSRASRDGLSAWNANARGVDINHNFDAGWAVLRTMEQQAGIYGPAPRRFGGAKPESEPETRAVTALCRRYDVRHLLAIHSQGEELYWEYGTHTPGRARTMARLLSAASGYALVENDGLASHGGCKDWFINAFSRPAFTVEVGKGKNPLPLEDFEEIYQKIEEMLVLAALM